MWIDTKFLINDEEVFMIYGKSIFLAQKFESTCSEVLSLLRLLTDVNDKKYDFLDDEYIENSDRLSNLMLGGIIRQAVTDKPKIRITDDEINILNDARYARNWIAHDMTIETIKNNVNAYDGNTKLSDEFVENLKYLIRENF